MAVRFDAAGEYFARIANMPLITSFTVMGWSYIHTDRGAVTQAIFGMSNNPATTADVFFSWDNSSDIMDIGSYVSAGAEFSNFGSRPAVTTWFHWYVRCSGTGVGFLQAGWADVSATAYVTAATQLDGSAATGQLNLNQSGFSEYCDQSMAAVKIWNVPLTDAEIAAERWIVRPHRAIDLVTWMPMIDSVLADTSDDWSGNGFDFSQFGSPAIADGPPISFGGAPSWSPILTAAGGAKRLLTLSVG